METDGNNLFINNYVQKLNEIKLEHLHYVEKDLAFYEKVSLAFLLYGSDKVNSQIALQKLLVIHNNKDSSNTDILFEFTKIQSNWRNMLVEALAIIKANRILKKLAFNSLDLKVLFLPHIPETTTYIHPILKILYVMCENLTPVESGRLIIDINNKKKRENHLRCYDFYLTELFLLDWMNNSLIDIGTWPYKQQCDKPNLDILIKKLESYEKHKVKKLLEDACDRFNKKIEILNSQSQPDDDTSSVAINRIHSNENDCAIKIDNFHKIDSCSPNDSEKYLINRESSGYVLIINQEHFYMETNPKYKKFLSKKELKVRRGSEKDKLALEATFQMFNYKIIVKNDLDHMKMLDLITNYAKRSSIQDSFIVCILSHGAEGGVFAANSVFVTIEEIKKTICKRELLNKPKWLILQACQGDELQKAINVNELEFDSPGEDSSSLFADLIMASSTIPRFGAIRHIRDGTWFIGELCKKIDELGDRKHVVEICTAVIRDVSKKRGSQNECMLPEVTQTLTKDFFLPKRF